MKNKLIKTGITVRVRQLSFSRKLRMREINTKMKVLKSHIGNENFIKMNFVAERFPVINLRRKYSYRTTVWLTRACFDTGLPKSSQSDIEYVIP